MKGSGTRVDVVTIDGGTEKMRRFRTVRTRGYIYPSSSTAHGIHIRLLTIVQSTTTVRADRAGKT